MSMPGVVDGAKVGTSRRRRISPLRVAILVGLLGVASVGSYFLWRATTLRGLPEIADPFDVARYATVNIPDDDNAFTFYRRAHARYRDNVPGTMKGAWTSWPEVTPGDIAHLEANRETLAIWLEGTRRDRGVQIQPGRADADTMLSPTQTLRNISRIANLEALRLEHLGDQAGAWTYLRGNLRASRHSGQNGFLIERFVGHTIYWATSVQVTRWSADPKVDAALLRRALADVLAVDAMTAKTSEIVRTEYFVAMNTLDDAGKRERAILAVAYGSLDPPWLHSLRHRIISRLAFVIHEPERSRRVIRLLVANWLSACDLPGTERRERNIPSNLGPLLYRPDPGETPPIDPDRLAEWYETTYFAANLVTSWRRLELSFAHEEAARADLIVHLATQLHRREHGQDPPSAEALVGPYLKALPDAYVPPVPGGKP